MKEWEEFSGNVTFTVGDGSRANFGAHKWCGDNTLESFISKTFIAVHVKGR